LVFPVVNKGFDEQTILRLLSSARPRSAVETAAIGRKFSILRQYECGGFAKKHPAVLDFVRFFQEQTGILLDPIYTAKMLYGVFDMLRNGDFPPHSIVVAVHTGGLQGWDGFQADFLWRKNG
jgi:1-aminocyclopropane-1-carboxylate deaminase/D-cysteine desulfhydrase-like pyridoxal-dependent ACC family enzyme